MVKFSGSSHIDRTQTMYPSESITFTGRFSVADSLLRATVFGYSLGPGQIRWAGHNYHFEKDWYFSLPIKTAAAEIVIESAKQTSLFVRHGYLGQTILGAVAEERGRLSYIDGCSDSLLVFPSRLGDPSLNLLYFPAQTQQSFHTHPSIRLGLVASGSGFAECRGEEIPLNAGDVFCLDEHELHRFKTGKDSMRVVAYHPDGDFGPTDQDHAMINRTYLNGPVGGPI